MKKILSVILFLVFVLNSFAGCRVVNVISDYHSSMVERHEKSEFILECMNEGRAEDIYDLFSEEAKEQKYLLERIQAVIYYYQLLDLDTTSPYHENLGGGKSYGEGRTLYEKSGIKIGDIGEKDGIEYAVEWYEIVVDEDEPERTGLYTLDITYGDMYLLSTFSVAENDNGSNNEGVNNMYEKTKSVIDAVYELENSNKYLQADDTSKYDMMYELLNKIATSGTDAFDESLIKEDSIEVKWNYNYDCKLWFAFTLVDGQIMRVIIPNFQGEIKDFDMDDVAVWK